MSQEYCDRFVIACWYPFRRKGKIWYDLTAWAIHGYCDLRILGRVTEQALTEAKLPRLIVHPLFDTNLRSVVQILYE